MEAEVTSNSKLATARTGEQIAMVLSALVNSGGGVLILHLVTKAGDVNLDMCLNDVVRLITQQETGISKNVFSKTISVTKNEVGKEIYFFADKTTHLVTHNSNAYDIKQSNPECIVDNNIVDVIRTCSCLNDTICEKHKDLATESVILSRLPNTNRLILNQSFPALDSDSETHFYRYYQLNRRSLADVLNTQSVQCEILELVSALANTNGGSIFLGVTNTATPTLEGYWLTENDQKCTEQCISDILTGRNRVLVTIWGQPQIESTHYWKTFIHDVFVDNKVIEIRVNKCSGGMFCALPVCLDIKDTGEIHQIDSFAEWKKQVLQSTGMSDSSHDDDSECYDKHFERTEMTDKDTPPDSDMPPPTGTPSTIPKPHKQTVSSSQFCWWLSDDDGVVAESLQFDQCCSKELADSVMDISTSFSTFPPTEAISERFANIEHLDDILKEILQEHQGDNGVAVFMENVPDAVLPIYGTLKHVTPVHHVFDLVIVKENQPPVIVTIIKEDCDRDDAKKYCLKLGQLLKRDCSKYTGMDKGNMKFFFQCQLYFIGRGYVHLQQEVHYPKDYLHPSTETLNTVRYALARILLDCQHITDRYGNIMVRHLSSYQAKVLLGRKPKVLIVKAIAGSGKTVLALEMARRIKKQHGSRKILFLCRSRGLAAFVQSQTKGSQLFESVIECDSQSPTELSESFSRYTDIIIDDAHAIRVYGEPTRWTIYNALFSSLQKCQRQAYIFLDPDLQDYRGCMPDDFVTNLEALAGRYVGKYHVKIEPLGKILRNSRRICQFTKACMGTDDVDELNTVLQIPEDGVFFHNIQGKNLKDTSQDDTTLLFRLSNLKQYRMQDIAIVTDSQEDKAWVKQMLEGKYSTQDATLYPRQCVVVDCKDNVQDWEFPVILVIVPQSEGTACSWYVQGMLDDWFFYNTTPCRRRVEFLLPWDPSQRQPDLTELKEKFSQEVNMLSQCIHNMHNTIFWAKRIL